MATNKVDENVKVVYVLDSGEDYKLGTGLAEVFEDGSITIPTENGTIQKRAGEWLTYLTFKKASNTMYTKAVKLAKKRYGKDAK